MVDVSGRSSVIISVFSTTPGIGKTVVAINLAAGLAHEGYSVCLVDLDLQFGDVLNYLQLVSPQTIAGAQRAMLNDPENFHVRNFLIDYGHQGLHFSIMPAPVYVFDAYQMDVQAVEKMISQLNYFEFVILDLNSMFSALNLAMMDMSTVVNYLGVIDFLPALKNFKIGYDTLLRFEYEESKIRIVENRADSQKLIDGRDVERLLGEKFYHRLPNDFKSVRNSINKGQPLMFAAPESKLTRSFEELVAKYTNKNISPIQTETSGGFFDRLRRWTSNLFGK
ncbi:MAG: P-loop NTPase [Selenomonadaceae bacterium]|nr:P-loop NTPase [Selenomonadaceae bacterium]